jgi:hypothetical protein
MSEPTGFHDVHGIPIHVGDLIRVKHYRHYQRRRQMWLYFRVAKMGGRFVVQNWSCLDAEKWQCLLEHCGLESTEVLASSVDERDDGGGFVTFNERKRVVLT